MDAERRDLLIEQKRAEIEHYQGVLDRYQSGRWYDQGRRHMAELKAELEALLDGDE